MGCAADERIKVTVKDGAAQSGLTLAIRMDSATLAESIVEAAQAATADLQKQIEEKMASVTDELPFDLLKDAASAQANIRHASQRGYRGLSRFIRVRRTLPRRTG